MITMDWQTLKNRIYVWDGSWLDIYVHDVTAADWEKFARFVNQHFSISWYNGKTGRDESKIDFQVIREYWNGNAELSSTAKIFLDDIQINAHFFDKSEIENDIDPREFTSLEDHEKLMKYLTRIIHGISEFHE